MDWSKSPDVESVPGRLSGAFVVKGTRVAADAVIDNAEDGFTAEEIVTEIYEGLPLERVRGIIEFARQQMPWTAARREASSKSRSAGLGRAARAGRGSSICRPPQSS